MPSPTNGIALPAPPNGSGDFYSISNSIALPEGSTNVPVQVTLINDQYYQEPALRTFLFQISVLPGEGEVVGSAVAQISIQEDDQPTFTILTVSSNTVPESIGTVMATVTKFGPRSGTVRLRLVEGTAVVVKSHWRLF